MTVFDAGVAILFADPNFGTAAKYVPANGAPLDVTIVYRTPDEVDDLGGGAAGTQRRYAEILEAELSGETVRAGDHVEVGSEVMEVLFDAESDVDAIVRKVTLRLLD